MINKNANINKNAAIAGEMFININYDKEVTLHEYADWWWDETFTENKIAAIKEFMAVNNFDIPIDKTTKFIPVCIMSNYLQTDNITEESGTIVIDGIEFDVDSYINLIPTPLLMKLKENDLWDITIPVILTSFDTDQIKHENINMVLSVRQMINDPQLYRFEEKLEQMLIDKSKLTHVGDENKEEMKMENSVNKFRSQMHQARDGELEWRRRLLDAQRQVALCYMEKAANNGLEHAPVYCPFIIRKEFMNSFKEDGFSVEVNQYKSSFVDIIWDKEEYMKRVKPNNGT